MVMAMPAELNPRSAMAAAILRKYDKKDSIATKSCISDSCRFYHHRPAGSESVVDHSEKVAAAGSHDGRSVLNLKRSSRKIPG